MIIHQSKFCTFCGKISWVESICTNPDGHHFVWAYRLKDGTRGSEYQAVQECLQYWYEQKIIAELKIKEYMKRLETAEK